MHAVCRESSADVLQDKTKNDTVKWPASGHALASTLAGSVSWTLFVTTLLFFMLVGYKDCGICVKKIGEFVTVGLFPSHPGKEGVWDLLHVCMWSSEEKNKKRLYRDSEVGRTV